MRFNGHWIGKSAKEQIIADKTVFLDLFVNIVLLGKIIRLSLSREKMFNRD